MTDTALTLAGLAILTVMITVMAWPERGPEREPEHAPDGREPATSLDLYRERRALTTILARRRLSGADHARVVARLREITTELAEHGSTVEPVDLPSDERNRR